MQCKHFNKVDVILEANFKIIVTMNEYGYVRQMSQKQRSVPSFCSLQHDSIE